MLKNRPGVKIGHPPIFEISALVKIWVKYLSQKRSLVEQNGAKFGITLLEIYIKYMLKVLKNRPGVKIGHPPIFEISALFKIWVKYLSQETEPRRAKRSKIWDHPAINLHFNIS